MDLVSILVHFIMMVKGSILGKLNRETEYFFKAGSILFELAKRHKVPLSMAIVDIDDMVLLDEKYGKKVFNNLIEHVHKNLVKKCRTSDLVSYLGDGRFGLLLYNISGINTDIVLNEIRKKIAHNRYKVHNDTFNITVSIGAIIIHSHMNDETFENVYDKVYLAVNAAREKGKSRVAVF